MKFLRARILLPATLLLIAAAVLFGVLESDSAEARGGICGKSATYAAPDGDDDGGDGSFGDPYRSVERLVQETKSGEVACLREGTYEIAGPTLAITKPIRLTSFPGIASKEPGVPSRSDQVTIEGRLAVNPGAEGTVIRGLRLDGGPEASTNPAVFADNTTLRGNEITNEGSDRICLVIDRYRREPAPRGVKILLNRVHDCGDQTDPESAQFDQAVYVANSVNATISGNWIYDNAARGVQLYPNAQGTLVKGNVIDGNGVGLSFGGDDETASSGNLVRNNVISNSDVRWNVEASWAGVDDELVGERNLVTENCVLPANPGPEADYYNSNGGIDAQGHPNNSPVGYSLSAALIADPEYADREGGDFTIGDDSPCSRRALLGSEPWSRVECVSTAYPSSSSFTGGEGVDVLAGTEEGDYIEGGAKRDTLDGLAGGDCIRGAGGSDSLIGGSGFDRLFGGDGGATVQAADGFADAVSCGNGADDSALADIEDTMSGCERVSYP